MSSVDQRIARMELDNSQFEKAARQTITTLNDLDKSLDLKNATNGLKEVERTANGLSLATLEKGVGAIQDRFDALGTFAGRILENIADDAYRAGKRLAEALTVEPLKSGFQEYETQINAVQTILANTSAKGTGLDDVNAALDELNTYADKTIYNFTEMTRNIGTFTAAGIDLDTSTQAIKGIANLAAVSGSTSQQASTAMYQLSQALASGTVKLQDWNSVVNAGMGGQVFQDALKETARLHGVAVDQMIEEEGSFRNTLQKGWLTSEVLTETLEKFTGDLTEQELAAMGYNEEQIASIIKMGETANDAATKVKTFTQLFDTLKEAMQSGWTQSWEIIIGDFEEAKELLTSISDLFSGIIGDSAQARNDLLEGALGDASTVFDEFGALVKVSLSDSSIQDALTNAAGPYSDAVKQMIADSGSFEESLKQCWLSSDVLNNGLAILSGGLDVNSTEFKKLQFVADKVLNGDFGEGEEQVKALAAAGLDYAEVQKAVTTRLVMTKDGISKLSDEQIANTGYTREQLQALKDLANESETSGKSIVSLYQEMTRPSGRDLIIDSFKNALTGLGKILGAIKEAWENVFPPATAEQVYSLIERINDFSKSLIASDETIEKFKRTFQGVFSVIKIGVDVIKVIGGAFLDLIKNVSPVGSSFLDAAAKIGDFFTKVAESGVITEKLSGIVNKVTSVITTLIDKFKEFIALPGIDFAKRAFSSFGTTAGEVKDNVINSITNIISHFNTLRDGISDRVGSIKGVFESLVEVVRGIADKIKERLAPIANAIKEAFGNLTMSDVFSGLSFALKSGVLVSIISFIRDIKNKLGDAADSAKDVIDGFKDILDTARGSLELWQTSIKADVLLKIAAAVGILAVSLTLIAGVSDERLIEGLAGVSTLLAEVVAVMAVLDKLEVKGQTGNAAAIVLIATAITILAGALNKLDGFQSWDDTWPALVALAGALTGLVAAVVAIDKAVDGKKLMTKAASLVILSTALSSLAKTMAYLGTLDIKTIETGLTALLGLVAELGVLSFVTSFNGDSSSNVLQMAASVLILYEAVKLIGELDPEVIQKGVIAVGALLTFLGLASAVSGVTPGGGSTSFLAMAAAILALMVPIRSFAEIYEQNKDALEESVLLLEILMATITGLLAALSLAGNFGDLTGAAAGLVGFSAAILLVSQALKSMNDLDLGMLVASLASLAAVVALFAGAAMLLAPVGPALLVFSASFALFGAGITAVAVGLEALILVLTSLSTLAPVVAAGLQVLVETLISGFGSLITTLVTSVVETITGIVTSVVEGFTKIIQVIGEAAPTIGEAITSIVTTAANIVIECAPKVIEAVKVLITSLLNALIELAPLFGETAVALITAFLDAITELNDKFTETAVTLIRSFLKGIQDLTDDIVDTAVNLITTFLEGIRDSIDEIVEVAFDIVSALLGELSEHAGEFVDAAITLLMAFIDGLSSVVPDIANKGIDMIIALLGAITERIPDIADSAVELITAFINALADSTIELVNAGFEMIITFLHGLADSIRENMPEVLDAVAELATAIIDGIVDGLTSGASTLLKGVTDTGKRILSGFTSFFETGSPSRLMRDEVGVQIVKGIANGIIGDKSAEQQSDAKGRSILDVFKEYSSKSKDEVGTPMAEGVAEGISANTSPEKAASTKVKDTQKAAEEEIKLLKDDLGNLFVQGIANGIKEDMTAEEAAAQKAKNIAEAFKKEMDKYDLSSTTLDLETELWEAKNPTATDQEKASASLENLAYKTANQLEAQRLAEEEYQMNIDQFGKESQQAQEAYNKMLKAQIETANLQNEYKETRDEAYGIMGDGRYMNDYDMYYSKLVSGEVKAPEKRQDPFTDMWNAYTQVSDYHLTKAEADKLHEEYQANLGKSQVTEKVSIIAIVPDSNAVKEDFKSVGKAADDGIKEGVENNLPGPLDAVGAVSRKALDRAKQELGIHSPSKAFEEIGKYIDQGLAKGINALSSVVGSTAEDLVTMLLGVSMDSFENDNSLENAANDKMLSVMSIIGMINSLIEGEGNQPVIRPVVDMTNANAAASQIGSMFGVGGYTTGMLSYNSSLAERNRALAAASVASRQDDSRLEAVLNRLDMVGDRIYNLRSAIDGMHVTIDGTALVGRITDPLTARQGLSSVRINRGI